MLEGDRLIDAMSLVQSLGLAPLPGRPLLHGTPLVLVDPDPTPGHYRNGVCNSRTTSGARSIASQGLPVCMIEFEQSLSPG